MLASCLLSAAVDLCFRTEIGKGQRRATRMIQIHGALFPREELRNMMTQKNKTLQPGRYMPEVRNE